MKYLVTGGAGFIGSHFLKMMCDKNIDDVFVCVDFLQHENNIYSINHLINKPNFKFVKMDICHCDEMDKLFQQEQFDIIVNFAALSHVDDSIHNAKDFYKSNTEGVLCLLELCKKYGIKRFHQVSTDEVYGDVALEDEDTSYDEGAMLKPSNPYSASKAAADLLVLAYHRTFNIPVTISRCTNNYGSFQSPDKLIPLMISKILKGERLPLYSRGEQKRNWISVLDHCNAIDLIIQKGTNGEIYNISSEATLANIEIVEYLLTYFNLPKGVIEYVQDRPGHDLKYSISSKKIKKQLNWQCHNNFITELKNTIDWYVHNKEWLLNYK